MAVVRDISHLDLSSHMGPVTSKGGLKVGFFFERIHLRTSNPARNGALVTRLVMSRQPKGDAATVSLVPVTPEQAAHFYPAEWSAFVNMQDTSATSGTPLAELPGTSRAQLALASLHGLHSVEDMVELDSAKASSLGLEIGTLRKRAEVWLQNRKRGSKVIEAADENLRLEREAKGREAQTAALLDRIRHLEAALVQQSTRGGPAMPPAVIDVGRDAGPMPDMDIGPGDMATGNGDLAGDPDPLKD